MSDSWKENSQHGVVTVRNSGMLAGGAADECVSCCHVQTIIRVNTMWGRPSLRCVSRSIHCSSGLGRLNINPQIAPQWPGYAHRLNKGCLAAAFCLTVCCISVMSSSDKTHRQHTVIPRRWPTSALTWFQVLSPEEQESDDLWISRVTSPELFTSCLSDNLL